MRGEDSKLIYLLSVSLSDASFAVIIPGSELLSVAKTARYMPDV